LKDYAKGIPGFVERVGEDFAKGHKEATGGIIPKVRRPTISDRPDVQTEFSLLLEEMGVPPPGSPRHPSSGVKGTKVKVIDKTQTKGIKDFFPVVPTNGKELQAGVKKE
jgi:hypothetical protein